MRWASYRRDGRPGYGLVVDGGIVEVSSVVGAPATLRLAIETTRLAALGREAAGRRPDVALDAVEMLPPLHDADKVVVAPVYAAGEAPIDGVNRDTLVEGLRVRGHRDAVPLAGPDELAPLIAGIVKPGDYVVCLGAGSITQWAYALPGQLEKLGKQ